MTPISTLIAITLTALALTALVWWQRRRERERATALAALARGLRNSSSVPTVPRPRHLGPPPAHTLHVSAEVVAVPRRKSSVLRHAPYVPDAPLPPEACELPLFRRGPHRFARNLLAAAGDDHEMRVFDYGASEERVDERAAITVALFHSRVLRLPDAPLDSEMPDCRETMSPPLRERIAKDDALVVQGSGTWLAVYHRRGLVPDDQLERFVEDARRVHDMLANGTPTLTG
jgi:hypothetical protein